MERDLRGDAGSGSLEAVDIGTIERLLGIKSTSGNGSTGGLFIFKELVLVTVSKLFAFLRKDSWLL